MDYLLCDFVQIIYSLRCIWSEIFSRLAFRLINSQRTECKTQGPFSTSKVQKADREKMRRDKLNEQFQELGNTLGMMLFSVSSLKIG